MSDSIIFKPVCETQVKLSVTKNGEACPYVIATDGIAKRCRALRMIHAELDQAIAFTSLIDDAQPPQIALALWHAAIMSYARCFSDAWGRGTTLEKEHVREFDSNAETFHDNVMELRNQYVAHAGNHGQEITIVVVSLAPASCAKAVEGVAYGQVATMGPSPDERTSMIAMCNGLKKVASDRLATAEKRLLSEYQNKDIDELYNNAVT